MRDAPGSYHLAFLNSRFNQGCRSVSSFPVDASDSARLLYPLRCASDERQSDESCYAHGSPCHVDSRLEMVGTDKPSLQAFLGAMKAAVRANDRPAIAKLVKYPLRVNGDKKRVFYNSPVALLAAFDSVFTPGVLSVIERAEYENLFVNLHGIMFGDGEIWCDTVKGAVFIKTVNLPPLFP